MIWRLLVNKRGNGQLHVSINIARGSERILKAKYSPREYSYKNENENMIQISQCPHFFQQISFWSSNYSENSLIESFLIWSRWISFQKNFKILPILLQSCAKKNILPFSQHNYFGRTILLYFTLLKFVTRTIWSCYFARKLGCKPQKR